MIDFRLLRHFTYFLAVAEEKHFGKAAKRLGMSQPPLSQQIQILEKSLGVRLFERSRQGVQLSREGAAILAPVHRFMEHAQRLQQAVSDARQGRTDIVTIGAINSAMFDIMPRLMRSAKQYHAHLSLSVTEMQSAYALAAVQSGEIDIAFARFDDQITALEVQPIVHDHLVLVLPIDHPLTKLGRVSLKDLANESFVLFPRRFSPSYFDQIINACRNAGFSPHVLHEVSSVVSQIAFAGCGTAVGMVPSRAMRFGGGDVVFRPLVERIDVVSIAAAFNPASKKALVSTIVEMAMDIGADREALPIPDTSTSDVHV
ncbi:MAG TPA: LysR family transcriptional regulator [Xanthobacteraceae bacterium]|jgi:DNA-binding transcriptional LysR family regulator|nr:LysR family transcriptional regulator [Xanthobacteraceae bacterium]